MTARARIPRDDLYGPLEQTGVRTRVIRALARGRHPAAIAHEHGVTLAAIAAFERRHAVRIADVNARMHARSHGEAS